MWTENWYTDNFVVKWLSHFWYAKIEVKSKIDDKTHTNNSKFEQFRCKSGALTAAPVQCKYIFIFIFRFVYGFHNDASRTVLFSEISWFSFTFFCYYLFIQNRLWIEYWILFEHLERDHDWCIAAIPNGTFLSMDKTQCHFYLWIKCVFMSHSIDCTNKNLFKKEI